MKNIFFAVSTFALFSCAQTAHKRDLEAKLAGEPAVADYASMRKAAEAAVRADTTITDEQKAKLIELKVETAQKMDGFQNEILKLKGALMKNIVADRYNAKEITTIKGKIDSLSTQKLHSFYEALEKGRKILGKTNSDVLNQLNLDNDFRFTRESP